MSVALARKYRPRKFSDVAVQSHVSNTLRGAIARGRVAHGYLFCGPRGVGKTTLARVLAMALNCENKPDDGEHTHTPVVFMHSPTSESVQRVTAPPPTIGLPVASGLPSSVSPSQSSSMPLQSSAAQG